MGGKQKQAQRTKGNVKPSSSGRSAALLSSTNQFTGFSGVKEPAFPTYQNAALLSEEVDSRVDPNFQLVLKKMNKKDPTTRVKALQEFIKLVEHTDAEVLKGILPFWPRLFCMLVGDAEHRVREVANDAQRSVIVQAKRNMAPYLRSLAGPWFIAQFDTYPPAASAATRAFQEAFSPNKLVEVIAFCSEEILKFISDSLLNQPLGKLENTRSEYQERIIIQSLQGLSQFLRNVKDDELKKSNFQSRIENLLQSQHFWSYGIDKIALIRSAWLSLMMTILEKIPDSLKDHHQILTKRVLGRLDEMDPLVLPYAWQAALGILRRLQDWSDHCDLKKQVLPRIWNILQEAGYGCASAVFPNMLPILDSLLQMQKVSENDVDIVDSFFKSLQEGFHKKTVQQSKSESEAVVQCYVECIRYLGKHSVIDTKFISSYLIPVIGLCLTESKLNFLSKAAMEQLSYLLQHWSSEKNVSQFEGICNFFWDSLIEHFRETLLNTSSANAKVFILDQQVQFCCVMKDPEKFKNKSLNRVRFSNEDNHCKQEERNEETANNRSTENIIHNVYLNKFVMSVTLFYLQRISGDVDLDYVIPLAKLISEFRSHEIIYHLVSNCSVSELFAVLSRNCFASSGRNVSVVLDLAFSIIQHLTPTEREEILNTVCLVPEALSCIFQAAQKKTINPYVLQWLQTPYLNNQLILLVKEIKSGMISSQVKDVLLESSKTSDGAFLVNLSTISLILSELSTSKNADIVVYAAQFLSCLRNSITKIPNISSLSDLEDLSKSTFTLTVALFSLCCAKEEITESEKEILFHGWEDGVAVLVRIAPSNISILVSELSGIIRNNVVCSDISTIDELLSLEEISGRLLRAITLSGSDELKTFALFTNGILAGYGNLETQLIVLCNNLFSLLGTPVSYLKTELPFANSEEILQFILLSLFSSMIVMNLISLKPGNGKNSEEPLSNIKNQSETQVILEDSPPNDVKEAIDDSQLQVNVGGQESETRDGESYIQAKHYEAAEPIVIHLALAASICEILSLHFKNMPFYHKAGQFIDELLKNFIDISNVMQEKENINSIKQILMEKANNFGGSWVHAVFLLCKKEEWLTIHKLLSESRYSEHSAEVFFRKALMSSHNVSIEDVGEFAGVGEITYWIKYMEIDANDAITSVIKNQIQEWIKLDHKERLYNCDVSRKSHSEVEKVVKEMNFLSACVLKCPFVLEDEFWDFIIISAAYYAQNLKHLQQFISHSEEEKSILIAQSLKNEKLRNVASFSVALFNFMSCITEVCQQIVQEESLKNKFEDKANEWENVFADDVRSILTNLFVHISGSFHKEKPSYLGHIFLQKLCSLMIKMNNVNVTSDIQNKSVSKTLSACCELLHSPVISLQIASYYIFKTYLKPLVEKDAATVFNYQDLEETVSDQQFEIHPLLKALQNTQAVVNTLLADFSFGDSCIIQPHTDSYYYTAAYLLLWNLILDACGLAGSELRCQYATLLRSEEYLSSFLNNLFFLMPSEILEINLPVAKSLAISKLFSIAPQLCISKECSSQQLQHWSCWMYCSAVSRLPVLVRQWWSDTKPKMSAIVQKATVRYVTPLLCMKDLQAVQNHNTKWKNMEVKVHGKARQVVAIYTIDDQQMELIITLPEEYPLATIQVDSHTSSLVGTSQWRNWVKQLSIFLTHQNGSLWDGLLLWKSNLDKRFEGVEECYICFSILHGTNFQIPKLCCKTCKKKFHSPCLYKWFSTSNKSTCPICRNLF